MQPDTHDEDDPHVVPPPTTAPPEPDPWHWTRCLGVHESSDGAQISPSDIFERRTGINPYKDRRVFEAAFPGCHWTDEDWKPAARRRGRPREDLFGRCVVATADLVHERQGKPKKHDWIAVTMGMIGPGNWGPDGLHATRWSRDARERRAQVERMRDRVEEAYRREMKRRRAARRIKPPSRRIKPPRR